jgi:hypothetical protein
MFWILARSMGVSPLRALGLAIFKYSILWARKSNSLAAGVVCIELDQTGQSLGFDYGVPLLFG